MGRSADPEAYEYIASYSRYEKLKPHPYPAVLATTSVADDRVGYREPAKWIARLRAYDTSKSPKMLHAEIQDGKWWSGRPAFNSPTDDAVLCHRDLRR